MSHRQVALGSLPPLRVAHLPKYVGLAAAVGAGIVWASIGQGSGELIWWPYLVAKYGTAFVGWLLPACVLGYVVNLEVIRYVAVTGENIFTGFSRVSRVFSAFMWIMLLITFLWFGGYASAGGTALAALTGWPVGWSQRAQSLFWGYACIAIYLVPIVFGRVVYTAIEWIMRGIAVFTVVGLAIAIFHPHVIGQGSTFLPALLLPKFAFPTNWDARDAERLVTAVTFTGMGGFFTLMYSYWVRDKGIGMAGRIGRITSPITGKPETIPATGFVPCDTPENRASFRNWLRALYADNAIGVLINTVTLVLLVWLSWAILRPEGKVPGGWEIAVHQARFFAVSWGRFGSALFLVVAAAFLSDTWLGTVDAVARMHSDYLCSNFQVFRRRTFRWWYYLWVAVLTIVTCVTMLLDAPGPLIIMGALFNFVAMAVYCPVLIYLNYVLVPSAAPSWVRPPRAQLAMIALASLAYIGLAAWYISILVSR